MPSPQPALEAVHALPRLTARAADANKGAFGRVLVVAGSHGMSGAAVLCGSAALRGGAGTVHIAVPDVIQPIVAAGQVCATTAGLPSTANGQLAAHGAAELLRLAQRATVLAVGPGRGQGRAVAGVVRHLLEQINLPIVLDADGLNVLGLLRAGEKLRTAPAVITPHPGEFARLAGTTTAAVQADREAAAVAFAED